MTAGRTTIVGLDGGPLGEAALAALSRAELVVGWPEQVDAVRHLLPPRADVREVDRDLPAALAAVRDADGEAVLLDAGDPGFHGAVGAAGDLGAPITVVPGIASVAAAFAAAGLAWEDAHLVSAHRQPPHRAVAVCRRFAKVAVLTGPELGPAALGAALRGLPRRLVVCERLGLRGQRVTRTTPEAAAAAEWADPNVVLVLDEEALAAPPMRPWSTPPRTTAAGWALPVGSDQGADGDGTDGLPAAVTALALAWAGPGYGDLVWAIGAPTLAVEAARLGAAAVAAGEPAHVGRLAGRAGVPVDAVPGRVPAVLPELPDPDAVVVVGGDHLLTETVRAAADRVRRAVVVVLAHVDRAATIVRVLDEAGLDVDSTRIATSGVGDGPLTRVAVEHVVIRGARR